MQLKEVYSQGLPTKTNLLDLIDDSSQKEKAGEKNSSANESFNENGAEDEVEDEFVS